MTTQTEAHLENTLLAQLKEMGWDRVVIADENALLNNLKKQLEKHNDTLFSDYEFKQILNKIKRGTIFEKAHTLRSRIDYKRDDGKTAHITLINQERWCCNEFQVTHQVTMLGKYKNRYDVTLLINGLPLCQIELKRRGLEMKEAFNQINRYHRESFGEGYGLFDYIQVFVISNGVNTKYYANNRVNKQDFKQTFYWATKKNERLSTLCAFADVFLEKCKLAKVITQYIVLNESEKKLMVLRPYQYYAVEAIVQKVIMGGNDGYIWHTTGSGKTLTSFKVAQYLTHIPRVHKTVFVVDRKDLDFQTIKEFNSFSKGSIDATNDTKRLVQQFSDDTPLIVTTLQKLHNAIQREPHTKSMKALRDKKIVFIFDECHRSQFGITHRNIKKYFNNKQMFGFTGTPIFAANAAKVQNIPEDKNPARTTAKLFGKCLHQYLITDAIRDENVLPFSVEYIRTFRSKDKIIDIDVEAIDRPEVMEADDRLDKITDYIIDNHNRKTHARQFNAIMCVSNIKTLMRYYDLLKAKREDGRHKLKIGTIFSYQANEEDADTNADAEVTGIGGDLPDDDTPINQHSRAKLADCIKDYNDMFGTNFSTDTFYNYYRDIGRRVKNKEIDILLVVNMFLTGFDSRQLNTIYVDKNLKYHGLLQAYSRTNRIMGQKKSQGNIVCFRNLKPATDQAIELFANKDALDVVLLGPYEDYVEQFRTATEELLKIVPDVASVDKLYTEKDEVKFIQAFRTLIRVKNQLDTFTQFTFDDLEIDEQTFADFRSKYLDLYDKVRSNTEKEKVSILDDIDFEIELITRDKINVSYIIGLLKNMQEAKPAERDQHRKIIMDIIDSEVHLRSKKELIDRFISEHLPQTPPDALRDKFDAYWDTEKQKALDALCIEEKLKPEKLEKAIGEYLYAERFPIRREIIDMLNERPPLSDRMSTAERVIGAIRKFIQIFFTGMD